MPDETSLHSVSEDGILSIMFDSDLRRFLAQHGIHLNKDLGQHFLINESVLETIVRTADIRPTDHILEIGAGIGILTRELLKRAQKVTAIEIDAKLIPLLKEFVNIPDTLDHSKKSDPFRVMVSPSNHEARDTNGIGHATEPPRLTIINNNALHVPFPKEPYKIVANIPYHITSPLLRHAFLESALPPTSLTLLIQREVAEKICDTKNAGLLTIVVSLFGAPRIVANIPPSAFLPPPKVDSAILHIKCFEKPLASQELINRIFALIKLAFSQKRKMLRNTVGSLSDGIDLLKRARVDPQRRPQTLAIDEWIRLAKEQ